MQCKRLPSIGRDVCAMHGGKTPKGFEHYKLKDGSRSKYLSHLPESLKTDFTKNFNADDIQSLREQVAVSNVRTQQLLALLSDGDFGNLWRDVKDTIASIANGYPVGVDITGDIAKLQNLAQIGESNFKTWQQINEQSERTRKLADTQIKLELGNLDRQIKEYSYIPKEFVRAFVLEMADVVMKLSPESVRHEQLSLIQKHFMALPPVIRDDAPKRLDKDK